jgi:hypothetical protein
MNESSDDFSDSSDLMEGQISLSLIFIPEIKNESRQFQINSNPLLMDKGSPPKIDDHKRELQKLYEKM